MISSCLAYWEPGKQFTVSYLVLSTVKLYQCYYIQSILQITHSKLVNICLGLKKNYVYSLYKVENNKEWSHLGQTFYIAEAVACLDNNN